MSTRIPVSEQRRLVACWRQSHQIHPNTFWGWTRRHPAKDRAVPLDLGTFIDVTASVEVSPPVVVTPSACARSLTVRLCASGQAPCEVGFFAGSDDAAQGFAQLLSLLATCQMHDIDPATWPADVLIAVGERGLIVSDLLPWEWKKTRGPTATPYFNTKERRSEPDKRG